MEREKILSDLGYRIQYLRKRKGLTQTALALRIDKDQQAVQRLEKGRVNPGYMYLLIVAKGLEVKIGDLLDFDLLDPETVEFNSVGD